MHYCQCEHKFSSSLNTTLYILRIAMGMGKDSGAVQAKSMHSKVDIVAFFFKSSLKPSSFFHSSLLVFFHPPLTKNIKSVWIFTYIPKSDIFSIYLNFDEKYFWVTLKAKYQNPPIYGNRKTPKNNWKLILNIHLTYIIKYTY